jgi:hypothetical protein
MGFKEAIVRVPEISKHFVGPFPIALVNMIISGDLIKSGVELLAELLAVCNREDVEIVVDVRGSFSKCYLNCPEHRVSRLGVSRDTQG